MREIKFRAWKKTDTPEMFTDVAYIDFNKKELGINYRVSNQTARLDKEPLNNIILMQYTGLKDKNGKEIYEGDIYDTGARKFIVKYDNERAGYYPFAKGDGCGCCSDEVVWIPDHGEVIGNIYENPELLEKEQSK